MVELTQCLYDYIILPGVECGPPEPGQNTLPVSSDYTAKWNQTYTYTCECEFETTDEVVATCVNGEWSIPPPNCTMDGKRF